MIWKLKYELSSDLKIVSHLTKKNLIWIMC